MKPKKIFVVGRDISHENFVKNKDVPYLKGRMHCLRLTNVQHSKKLFYAG